MERAKSVLLDQIDYEGFTREIETLRRDVFQSLCYQDFLHLIKIERIGKLSTVFGYATAWIIPNPISAFLIGQGILTRWLLMHHISHGGYDKVPGVPQRYTRKQFAQGWRRFIDWFDWILPDAWAYAHNILHHYHTGEDIDPDLVERHAEMLHNLRCPPVIKYLVLFLISITWKFSYYAPIALNSIDSHKNRQQHDRHVNHIRLSNFFDLRNKLVRKLWFSCYLPFFALHFGLIPLLFFPLGKTAVLFVLINRVLAEFITNFHSYMIILPNHAGADLHRFDHHFENKQEFYANQVLGSVNYNTGNDWIDYPQMWLNYQIEHHLVPNLPMTKYPQIQPKVKALCTKYNLPYIQESVFRRFRKFLQICVGDGTMIRVHSESRRGYTPIMTR
ncbi:fatty acid desaturase [Acidobacteria bacterium AH-259-A15]|nr:fatty acid desaturase [Acidobacteria bacterium AH-259-A15]